jgi:hypothetical protein
MSVSVLSAPSELSIQRRSWSIFGKAFVPARAGKGQSDYDRLIMSMHSYPLAESGRGGMNELAADGRYISA